ncbi:MAG: hypothetical protein ACMVO3_22880 [Thalassobaculum sp.]
MDNGSDLIDNKTYDAGEELLQQLDAMGFGATTAGWFIEPDSTDWKLLFITPLIAEKGPRWVYERLLTAVSSISDPEKISPLHVHVANSSRPYFSDLTIKVEVNGTLPIRTVLRNVDQDGVRLVDRAVLYRLDTSVRTASARKFDASVRKMAA